MKSQFVLVILFTFLSTLNAHAFLEHIYDHESLGLAQAAIECAAEVKSIQAEHSNLMEAIMEEEGEHEFDRLYVMTFGFAHPLIGVRKTHQLVIHRTFKEYDCRGRADCGGGTFSSTCEIKKLRN